MPVQISKQAKLARFLALFNLIDYGTNKARIEFYTGSQVSVNVQPSTSPICTIHLSKPCGSLDETSLTITLTPDSPSLAQSTGLITWARLINGNGEPILSGIVMQSDDINAASATFVLSSTNVIVGSQISLISAYLVEG